MSSCLSSEALPSSIKPLTQGNQLDMPELLLASRLRQMSHMEILQEGTRPDPRLRRLLGHMSTYDNVERWRMNFERQIFVMGTSHPSDPQTVQLLEPLRQSVVPSSEPTLKLRTLADYQAAIRSHFDYEQEITVSTEELTSDSDSEDGVESEVSSDDDSDNESTSTWSNGEDPILEFIREGTRSLLQQYDKDDIVFYSESSVIALEAADMEKR